MSATDLAIAMARSAARAADDRKGSNIVAYDVSEQLAITDIFVLVSGNSDRQVSAIVDAISETIREEFDLSTVRREGDRENRWVLMDYLDIVVHVQHQEERVFYSLERLWADCPRVDLELPEADS